MLKKMIKRDGVTVEDFIPSKLNKWGMWAADKLGDRVDWTGVVLDAVASVPQVDGVAKTQDLQNILIKQCLARKDWPHNLMAGRLFAAMMHKNLYEGSIPTVEELHNKLFELGLMKKMDYSSNDYEAIESFIVHDRDFHLAHFQLEYTAIKYGLKNLKTNKLYETTQFVYMRLAMALAEHEKDKEHRLVIVKDLYEEFSNNRINPPTPALNNLGTPDTGLASCCLYKADDSIQSLHAGDTIAYLMTAASAGIGGIISSRSIADPVRNGKILHKGKLPYLKAVSGAIKANTQGSRGGAICQFVPITDPEIESIIMLQNPRTPEDKQNRDVNISIQSNKFITNKALKKEKIFLFNCHTAPDLYESFFSKDLSEFERLYDKYEKDDNFKKTYIDAYKLVSLAQVQSIEVGTLYASFMDEINRHTPHLDPIYSSNLCLEITQPTEAYETALDLYADNDPGYIKIKGIDLHNENNDIELNISYSEPVAFLDDEYLFRNEPITRKAGSMYKNGSFCYKDTFFKVTEISEVKKSPEVSLCSLAAIVEPSIHSDEQYEKTAYYALYTIDSCIDIATYPLPHIKYTSMMRRNAGVGLSGIAYSLAKKGLKYSSQEGRNESHRIAERHSYFLIKAALKLGKERGNAPWMHKTLWPQGWLPIDTYKKSIDNVVTIGLQYDWETLREEIIANKGIRFSSLVAHMPLESSSKSSGGPNSLYPIRDLALSKTDGISKIDWSATDSDLYTDNYELAWNVSEEHLIMQYGIYQKFADQAISADMYKDRRGDNLMYSEKRLVTEYALMVKYGMKTRYYQNNLTSQLTEDAGAPECSGGACKM